MATTLDVRPANRIERPLPPGRQIRFSVEQYHAIQDAGALSELRRYELIRGHIMEKPVPKPAHVKATRKTKELIAGIISASEYTLRIQDPITLADSEPEPDIAVVLAPIERYDERHPLPSDIAMLVEIAETSLASDRKSKTEMYAAAGVPVYWIVNLIDGIVEVYTQPRGSKYRKRTDYTATQELPVTIARKTIGSIPVKEFLP